MKTFLVIFALAAIAIASPFTSCNHSQGTIRTVEISGCKDTDPYCVLYKGTNVNLSITFVPASDASRVTVEVYGLISGFGIPYPLPNSNACARGLICPLKNGETATYKHSFPVRNGFPSIALDVIWTLFDERKNRIICARLPVVIQ
ncbi:epididymal secretory protein E1-like [Varroa jacobsoni]|uniref:epididymal secretory protein E1-like n=1 Tax=Varroa jacobsoni TaxID=62625 RepID=UPI000BF487A9|nr:epididymal secretory protein E1-like [Varroa jacobsoni]